MADETPTGERTEAPSSKRREDFRKKGQVAQSREVQTAALMTLTLLFWFLYLPTFWAGLTRLLGNIWDASGVYHLTEHGSMQLLAHLLHQLGLLLGPLFLLGIATGFLSSYLQIGWLFTTQPLTPDLSKLDPIKGLSRFFSKRSLVELVKSLAKVLLIGWIAYATISGQFEKALLLTETDLSQTMTFLGRLTALLFFKICGILILLAVLDYAFTRYEMEEKMKMTKQEVKEEYKETEGDPHIKSKIRSIQQAMARRRMMAEVPKADVIITNPTHVAVALRYNQKEMDAPMVIAKGQELVAQKIKEIAREHNIPMVENPPVARLLHSKVAMGQAIPEELFRAVAEILAHVYALKGRH